MATQDLIPSGSQTYSKTRWPKGAPQYAVSGYEAYIGGSDKRRYLDYGAALGPVILGHRHPRINRAITEQLERRGITFSLPTELEYQLAELLVELVPCAEMVRFAKNGVDATAAAVRLARAYTKRIVVVSTGYHGYQDWCIENSDGVPGCCPVERCPPGELPDRRFVPPAAIIVEPIVAGEPTWPDQGWLKRLRTYADRIDSLLIFDEIVTGFRFPELSAQAHYGITPDLACFSKGMANGMPISAVVGRRDIMKLLDEGVFFSTTFGGETLSIAAAIATIEELKDGGIDRLWSYGEKLTALLKSKLSGIAEVRGWTARPHLKWHNPEEGHIFNEAMVANGVLVNDYYNVMACMGEPELALTEKAIDAGLARL